MLSQLADSSDVGFLSQQGVAAEAGSAVLIMPSLPLAAPLNAGDDCSMSCTLTIICL